MVPRSWAPDCPEGYDVADYVASGADREAVLEVLRSAPPVGAVQKMMARYREISSGHYRCIPWPWEYLTYYTRALIPGTITLITGGAGSMKSLFLLQSCARWMDDGEKVAVFQFEDDLEFHVNRFLAQRTGQSGYTDPDWVRQNLSLVRETTAALSEDIERFSRTWHIVDGADTLEQVAAWIGHQAEAGKRIICVDPITLAERTKQPWEADKEFIKEVKRIARRQQCSVVLVTHPQKGMEADLTTLAGGAAYERFTFTVIVIQPHEKRESPMRTKYAGRMDISHNVTIRVVKARNAPGHNVRLGYDFSTEGLSFTEKGVILKRPRKGKGK
ncbi:hypothetical protein DRQ05_05700 [bacterium]|nr:MAG: hypothetical protein DRQ05_05700 [bacterium]